MTGETSLSPPAATLSRSPLNESQSASPQSAPNDSSACEWSASAEGADFSSSFTSTHSVGRSKEERRTMVPSRATSWTMKSE
uniref:Uncharacterized protein n=1 Tax=Arundo donax TaxID=35708 RepID=A0A0A9GID1_ARUDO